MISSGRRYQAAITVTTGIKLVKAAVLDGPILSTTFTKNTKAIMDEKRISSESAVINSILGTI